MQTLLLAAQVAEKFEAPRLDYHALAPEIVLTGVLVVVLLVDLFIDETQKYILGTLAGMGVLAAMVPVITLAVDGGDRSMFEGAYVVDNFALLLKALFLGSAYVVLLMSSRYIEEGDYHQGEYYFLLLSSTLGMTVMASSRDLISIFVALELLSIPAYLLAGWRKRDLKSNEASLKYYLLGVLTTGVMLYGMSLIFGVTGETSLGAFAKRSRRAASTTASSPSGSSSSSWRSRSRSRRSRSTSGLPTPTRALPRRSLRSCRWPRRPQVSSP
ncbi:MAG: NADH-quinone oxidoreductase subunit N [Acidimicrobiia bacterium]